MKLEQLLSQVIQPLKNIPFELIIQSLFQTTVEKFDVNNESNKKCLNQIARAMSQVCKDVQANPIKRPRPNEVGNDIEAFVLRALNLQQLNASTPKTKEGKGKSAGYPDIKIETEDLPIYLEVKTHAADQIKTSLRSFFLSPAKNSKVCEDAYHLLVCFEILRRDNQFISRTFKIVDLYGLDCDMKPEFNSDNKRLYQGNRVLIQGNELGFKINSSSTST